MDALTARFRLPALAGAMLLLGGCAPNGLRHFDGDPWVRRNAEVLDRMGALLNEFGSVGMSAPLIMAPGEKFNFEIKEGPQDYFDQAKKEIQGRAAAAEQEVSLLGLSVSASVDPTQMAQYAEQLKNYHDQRLAYLRQLDERDRALRAASEAKKAAAQLTLNGKLAAAKTPEDQAAAYSEYATAIASNAPDAPKAPDFPSAVPHPTGGSTPDAPEGATKARGVLPDLSKLTAPGSLLGTSPAVTSTNRSALITAAGDTAVEGILNALHSDGSPPPAALLGKKKLFAAAMVSVTPGWRTSSDFAARLTVRPTLEFGSARLEVVEYVFKELKSRFQNEIDCGRLNAAGAGRSGFVIVNPDPNDSKKTLLPLPSPAAITAVSPMTDTQHLQLSSSLRQRKERALQIALALQSAGLDAGAKLFYEHLSNLEKDVMTDNREVPITAFATGGQFGYEIGPELWSQFDPSAAKTRAGYRLVRQSFPTLILLGFDETQLRPRLWCPSPESAPQVVEPYLKLEQTRRWVPLNERAARYALSDAEVVALDDDATRAYLSPPVCSDGMCVADNVRKQIASRGNALAEELMGNFAKQVLPVCMVVPELPRCVKAQQDEERKQKDAAEKKQKEEAVQKQKAEADKKDKVQVGAAVPAAAK